MICIKRVSDKEWGVDLMNGDLITGGHFVFYGNKLQLEYLLNQLKGNEETGQYIHETDSEAWVCADCVESKNIEWKFKFDLQIEQIFMCESCNRVFEGEEK